MKTFLVFEPASGGKNSETAEKIVFLREKFSWPALFFAPIWLLWHTLWIGFIAWLAAEFAIGALTQLFGLHPGATALALWLPNLIVAFEASELRRRKLIRKGYSDAGIVVAENLEDAERRFFEEWVQGAEAPAPVRSQPRTPSSTVAGPAAPSGNPVIGLFPEPGARS
jgi:hypothetical protein